MGLDETRVLEVYAVTYIGHARVKPENQLGRISLQTKNKSYCLYDEWEVDMNKPSIEYGDPLPFNDVGPICSFTDIDMQIDLFRGACYHSVEQPCEELGSVDYLLETCIPSPHGHYDVSVLFGYFVHATVANLEVVLSPIPADANVYGVVAATNSRFDYTYCTSALFSKESANSIKVGHNGVIPLSKPRVGLPLGSQLIVDICLFCDDEPYKGTAYFTPGRENESSVDMIDGRINVKVTWNCNEDPAETTDDDFDYMSKSEYDSSDSESKDWEEYTENARDSGDQTFQAPYCGMNKEL